MSLAETQIFTLFVTNCLLGVAFCRSKWGTESQSIRLSSQAVLLIASILMFTLVGTVFITRSEPFEPDALHQIRLVFAMVGTGVLIFLVYFSYDWWRSSHQ